jgi:hypothetical protein
LESTAVRTYAGRKKAVKTFTTRQGLLMLAIVIVGLIGIIVLWLLGFLSFDVD